MASTHKHKGRWRTQVRRPGYKTVSKYTDTKKEGEAWARKVEADMDAGKVARAPSAFTLAEIIAKYRQIREESGREINDQATEHYQLGILAEHMGSKPADGLTVQDMVEFAQARRREGAGPSTINMDISKLGTVLRHTGSMLGLVLPDVVGASRPLLHHLKLIGSGGKRTRRPTGDELARLIEYAKKHAEQSAVWRAMPDIIVLALTVGLRRGEIFKIEWRDLNEATRMVLVRDRKDPRKKQGNDQLVPLIGRAWEIVQAQERVGTRIFPHHPQTVSKYFRQACAELGIPDLHFHDLRREAASALLEAGWTDREVKQITGHGSAVFEVYAKPDPVLLHGKVTPRGKV